MSANDTNLNGPQPVSEDVMCAWIEGELPAGEEARLAATHPDVAAAVRLMRGDRAALRAVGDGVAPARIKDRVIAALEREALVCIEPKHAGASELPVSQVQVVRERSFTFSLPRVARYAQAAALVLVAGGIAMWGWSRMSKPGVPSAPAMNLAQRAVVTTDATPNPANETVASVTPEAKEAGTDATMSVEIAGDAEARARLAKGEPSRADEAADALELAREGRLALRVFAKNAAALARFENEGVRAPAKCWSCQRKVPDQVIVAVQNWRNQEASSREQSLGSGPLVLASELPAPRALAEASMPTPLSPDLPYATYMVDMQATEEALAMLKKSLSNSFESAVDLAVLPDPAEPMPSVEPGAVLWWTQSSTDWATRVSVPVIVEAR